MFAIQISAMVLMGRVCFCQGGQFFTPLLAKNVLGTYSGNTTQRDMSFHRRCTPYKGYQELHTLLGAL